MTQPRAVVYTNTGAPDVLTIVDKALLSPGADEVRVRIHRSGLNPTDWKSRAGGTTSRTVDPPQVPGQDGAGIVDAIGSNVTTHKVGQRVWVWEAAYQRVEGSTQDYALVPANQAVPLPDTASFDLGAALGIPFITAHLCLTMTADGPTRLGPDTLRGRHVLVSGGAGAVGNAAIQLASWSGATVITTVSSAEKAALATAAGATHVINYREQDVVAEIKTIAPHGVNTVVEVSAAANAGIDADILARFGSVAMYADDGGSEISLPIRKLMAPNARWQFVLVYTASKSAKAQAVADISSAVKEQAIGVGESFGLPLHHFAFEDASSAHEAVQNSIVGKVLIDIARDTSGPRV